MEMGESRYVSPQIQILKAELENAVKCVLDNKFWCDLKYKWIETALEKKTHHVLQKIQQTILTDRGSNDLDTWLFV